MLNKLFLFSLLASFAVPAFAQSAKPQEQVALRVVSGNESADPFGWLETEEDEDDKKPKKAAGVKASVVVNMGDAERRAFDIINKIRADQGLEPLVWSDDLAGVGRLHSQNMAEFKFFSHRGMDSKLVSDRADALKVGKWRSIGENIAFSRGYDDPVGKAVELWLNSAEHKRNLMDANWKESAIGVAKAADGSVYFTQVFLTRR